MSNDSMPAKVRLTDGLGPGADTRKPCTCDGAGRGPGRACVVRAGGRLGELWRCTQGAEPKAPQIATCLDDADLSHL